MLDAATTTTPRAIKVLALHGMSKDAWKRFSDEGYRHYQVVEAGFKYNMMDLQAAIGIHQLERVEQTGTAPADLGPLQDGVARVPASACPPRPSRTRATAYHLYTVLDRRQRVGIEPRRLPRRHDCAEHRRRRALPSIPEHPYYHQNASAGAGGTPHAMRDRPPDRQPAPLARS